MAKLSPPKERRLLTVDATDKILGRLATQIAFALIGKTEVHFQPHLDVGAKVIVTNVDKIKVTGKKYEDKLYHKHSGHPGGLRTRTMRELWEGKGAAAVLRAAVSRMLPKNKHRTNRLKRLSIS